MQLVHHRRRGACRHEDAVPVHASDFGKSKLRERRHVGQEPRALVAGDRQRTQLAGGDVLRDIAGHRHGRGQIAAQQVGHHGRHAAVGHVGQFDARLLLKHQALKVHDRAGGRGAIATLVPVGLYPADVLRQCAHRLRHRRADDKGLRVGAHRRHRNEVFLRVIAEFAVHVRKDHHRRGGRQHHRRAIGRGPFGHLVGDAAAGANLRFDDHGLGILAAQLIGQLAGNHIQRSARGKADVDARGTGLGANAGAEQSGTRARCENDSSAQSHVNLLLVAVVDCERVAIIGPPKSMTEK